MEKVAKNWLQVCADVTQPWTLDGSDAANAKQDTSCITDYIGIPCKIFFA
jgi:hypothetical protein